jgi:site-specific recombinase XerD
MVDNAIKTKTINRRLSSFRRLSRFLTENGILDSDYMNGIRNVGIGIPVKMQKISLDIVEEFRKSLLEEDKASENTAKNYASDVRSFLVWMNEKGDLPNGL